MVFALAVRGKSAIWLFVREKEWQKGEEYTCKFSIECRVGITVEISLLSTIHTSSSFKYKQESPFVNH